MSDLYIMFDETYDAPDEERNKRLSTIAKHYKVALIEVAIEYFKYLDSDLFRSQRGI